MFATGVTVVTARQDDGAWVGLTVSSFNSLSLTPPLVLWSLGLQSSRLQALRDCSHYAVNVLSAQQVDLARHFATRGPDWSAVAHQPGASGAPLLDGCLAHFECRNARHFTEGDHDIFVGEVLHCARHPGRVPLLYHAGQFYTEVPL
jgi:flavin reductase (DIM6/NTAB) family NADH-FMN oxidoreductase RutF